METQQYSELYFPNPFLSRSPLPVLVVYYLSVTSILSSDNSSQQAADHPFYSIL